uniref:Cysteine desulfurase n=1 Tax=Tetraselmis sp. GSL018 TaxID=582737 RepID=A0A061S7P8_9CHLO
MYVKSCESYSLSAQLLNSPRWPVFHKTRFTLRYSETTEFRAKIQRKVSSFEMKRSTPRHQLKISAQVTARIGEAECCCVGIPLPFSEDCIYLDYNATTPIFPEVADEMQPFLTHSFGNPSSTHAYGQKTKAALDLARQRLADAVGASPEEIVFTSCGTESNNWAIVGAIEASGADCPHVVSTKIEHPAILECLASLARKGRVRYTLVGVDSEGVVDPGEVMAAVEPDTCLITVMHSNNEIGSLQPIGEIGRRAREAGIRFHTDAAQSLGKVPFDVDDLSVDLATFVAHKIGGPKGTAALYMRRGSELPKMLFGGGQEGGARAGTESMVLLSGFGKAAELLHCEGARLRRHMQEMRDRLRGRLVAGLPEDRVRFNGPVDEDKRVANTLSLSIKGANASLLLLELQDKVAASAGAACKRGQGATLSETLKAIQVPAEFALGTIRLSVGRHTTPEEIDRAAEHILEACGRQGIPVKQLQGSVPGQGQHC